MPTKPEQAPSRGCYDRALSRQVRHSEQRARLVAWIAETYFERGEKLSVQDVVAAAGVGRNTFYEYFDGLEHALNHTAQTCATVLHERIVIAIDKEPTTTARLRSLSQVWFSQVAQEPAAMSVLLRPAPREPESACATLFESLLRRALDQSDQIVSTESRPAWEACVAFAAEGATRHAVYGGTRAAEMQAALDVLLARVFR